MTINEYARRKCARRLRAIASLPDLNWPALMRCLGVSTRGDAVLLLADMVDAGVRTCRMRDTRWDDGQCTWGCICSECGAKREHESGRWFNFCPNCGARVIHDA
jgi:hypothetical protein